MSGINTLNRIGISQIGSLAVNDASFYIKYFQYRRTCKILSDHYVHKISSRVRIYSNAVFNQGLLINITYHLRIENAVDSIRTSLIISAGDTSCGFSVHKIDKIDVIYEPTCIRWINFIIISLTIVCTESESKRNSLTNICT